MSELIALWLPILVATFVCFVLSTAFWTFLPLHDKDFKQFPDADAFNEFFKAQNLQHGVQYMFPFLEDKKAMYSEEFKPRYEQGPWGLLRVFPGKGNMGVNIPLTFLFFLVVTVFIAYVLAEAVAFGSGFGAVFQVGATVGVLAYAAGPLLNQIWFRPPTRAVATNFVDGVVYGLVTGAVFGFLYPAATALVP